MEGGFTIIYVEDYLSLREAISQTMELGFSKAIVKSAANLSEAKALVAKAAKAAKIVVVTDMNYTAGRDMSGFLLIDHVHKRHPSIPCIVLAGITGDLRDRLMKLGVPFIDKGSSVPRDLIDAIKTAEMNGQGSGHFAAQKNLVPGETPKP